MSDQLADLVLDRDVVVDPRGFRVLVFNGTVTTTQTAEHAEIVLCRDMCIDAAGHHVAVVVRTAPRPRRRARRYRAA